MKSIFESCENILFLVQLIIVLYIIFNMYLCGKKHQILHCDITTIISHVLFVGTTDLFLIFHYLLKHGSCSNQGIAIDINY